METHWAKDSARAHRAKQENLMHPVLFGSWDPEIDPKSKTIWSFQNHFMLRKIWHPFFGQTDPWVAKLLVSFLVDSRSTFFCRNVQWCEQSFKKPEPPNMDAQNSRNAVLKLGHPIWEHQIRGQVISSTMGIGLGFGFRPNFPTPPIDFPGETTRLVDLSHSHSRRAYSQCQSQIFHYTTTTPLSTCLILVGYLLLRYAFFFPGEK